MTNSVTLDLVIFCFTFAIGGYLYFGWESRRLDRKYPASGSQPDRSVPRD